MNSGRYSYEFIDILKSKLFPSNSIFDSFNTLESICNLKYVNEWLITNASKDDMAISVENNTRN